MGEKENREWRREEREKRGEGEKRGVIVRERQGGERRENERVWGGGEGRERKWGRR